MSDPGQILRATSEVRHWIENRLRNTDLMLSDFGSVARGSVELHPSYLEPAVDISEEHQAMLLTGSWLSNRPLSNLRRGLGAWK